MAWSRMSAARSNWSSVEVNGGTNRITEPRAFSLDPQGNFLYAAGLESGRLASYRVNGSSGDLEPLEVYPVGQGPMWVLIAEL